MDNPIMRSPSLWPLLLAVGCASAPTTQPSEPQPGLAQPALAQPQPQPPTQPPTPDRDIVALPAGYTCAEPEQPPPQPPEPPKELTQRDGIPIVDVKSCEPATAFMPRALGHRTVEVMGKRDGACTIEITSEVEGGYSVHACRLKAGRRAKIPPGYEEGSNCELVRTGNDLLDRPQLELPRGVDLSGEGFVAHVEELEAGDGAGVETPGRTRIEVRFFSDEAFTAAIGESQTFSFDLGPATARPNLSRALVDHSNGLLRARVGSVRRVVLREEVADELEAFGPFSDEALLCLEARVISFEPGS